MAPSVIKTTKSYTYVYCRRLYHYNNNYYNEYHFTTWQTNKQIVRHQDKIPIIYESLILSVLHYAAETVPTAVENMKTLEAAQPGD